MRFAIAALALLAMAACAADFPLTIAAAPVTVALQVPAALRTSQRPILLQLEQVTTPQARSATWNMFIEMPDASASTPTDSSNFAGYVTTIPNPTARNNPPKGMSLQLPDSAAAIVRRLNQVRLTFVPTTPGSEPVRIGSVHLDTVQ